MGPPKGGVSRPPLCVPLPSQATTIHVTHSQINIYPWIKLCFLSQWWKVRTHGLNGPLVRETDHKMDAQAHIPSKKGATRPHTKEGGRPTWHREGRADPFPWSADHPAGVPTHLFCLLACSSHARKHTWVHLNPSINDSFSLWYWTDVTWIHGSTWSSINRGVHCWHSLTSP